MKKLRITMKPIKGQSCHQQASADEGACSHSPSCRKGLLLFVKAVLFSVGLFLTSAGNTQIVQNPILAGFYPDPSICRVGDTYYLVNSTFAYFPALPIHRSRNLTDWELIGYGLDNPESLDLIGLDVEYGLFAPSITYHDGLLYILCTVVGKKGNFVITAINPDGPWSDPVWLPEVDGIDPSLFIDDNGEAWITFSSVAPDNKPLYYGHRTIRQVKFDLQRKKVLTEPRILVNGGADFYKQPVWAEGPRLFKKEGWYYLLFAEGGTREEHAQVAFRSGTVTGPFVPYEMNPILTQRDLPSDRAHPITSVGHADLVSTPNGQWIAVFLGCRPYANDYYNTGRETFLAPVRWIDGWPIITKPGETISWQYLISDNPVEPTSANAPVFRTDFNENELPKPFLFLRNPAEKWYQMKGGRLEMMLRPVSCYEKGNPSFIGHRQAFSQGRTSMEMRFNARDSAEKAGLLLFQNEKHYYFFCQSIRDGRQVLQLFRSSGRKAAKQEEVLLWEMALPKKKIKALILSVEAMDSVYHFSYAYSGIDSKRVVAADATFLSTKLAGGFTGTVHAMYATSGGRTSGNRVVFDWFESTSYPIRRE